MPYYVGETISFGRVRYQRSSTFRWATSQIPPPDFGQHKVVVSKFVPPVCCYLYLVNKYLCRSLVGSLIG